MRYSEVKKIGFAYLLIAPAMICLILVVVFPLVQIFQMSLYKIEPMYSAKKIFCGLQNFIDAAQDLQFRSVLGQTAVWVFGSVIFQFIIGLIAALLLNQNFRGRGLSRGLLLIPWAMPGVVGAFAWKWLYHGQYGLINYTLMKLHIISRNINWLGDPSTAMFSCILTNTWRGFPFIMLMLLAGLQNIPDELKEAASIDGGSPGKIFRYVTLPLLKPVIVTITLLSSIWTFNNFSYIYILTRGGPAGKTDILTTYLYKQGFEFFHFGYAAALSIVLFLIVMVLSLTYIRIVKPETANGD